MYLVRSPAHIILTVLWYYMQISFNNGQKQKDRFDDNPSSHSLVDLLLYFNVAIIIWKVPTTSFTCSKPGSLSSYLYFFRRSLYLFFPPSFYIPSIVLCRIVVRSFPLKIHPNLICFPFQNFCIRHPSFILLSIS